MFAPRVKTMQGTSLVVFRDNEIWNVYEYSEKNVELLKKEIMADLEGCAGLKNVETSDKDYRYSNVVFRAWRKGDGHEYDRRWEYYRIQRY